jgi:hypothetical protein
MLCRDNNTAGNGHPPCVRMGALAYPDPSGPQHDETRSSIFRYFGKCLRSIDQDAPLHPSVLDRFTAAVVLDYDVERPYRPENLRNHDLVGGYYSGS